MIPQFFALYAMFFALPAAPEPPSRIALTDWDQVAGVLLSQATFHQGIERDRGKASVLIHGFINESRVPMDLTPLTKALQSQLVVSEGIALVQPGQAAIITEESRLQPAATVSRKSMLWYARQVGADLMLTGTVAPVNQREWRGLEASAQGQETARVSLHLLDAATGQNLWETKLLVTLPNLRAGANQSGQ